MGKSGLKITLPLPFEDMGVLYDGMTKYAPLPAKAVVDDPRELLIGISDLDTGQPIAISSHDLRDDPDKLFDALIGGASMPFGVIGKYAVGTFGRAADAGIFWPTSDAVASHKRPTHILSLASGPRPRKVGGLVQVAADLAQARWCSHYSKEAAEQSKAAARERDKLLSKFILSDKVQIDGTIVERIYPLGEKLPSRQTRDKALIRAGFLAGKHGVERALQSKRLATS